MKFFLDTANFEEIHEANSLGILDGITTNPTLIAKEGKPFKETIIAICNEVNGPVSCEVIATDCAGMLKQGRDYATWHKNIVVKLPTTREGVKACKTLTGEGTKTNLTLCFTPNQALIVAKAGATYVSPFIGRLDDISEDGMQVIKDIVQIYKNYGYTTQVLAASLRHPMHVVKAALAGAHVGTLPAKVLDQMFKHPLTDKGLETFLSDWKKANTAGS
ncbi:MAG: tal [Candidatus Angelobacter sp.]|jgi:transaldolase|nr:tal [Candidatus Angelobacter sp.]